MQGGGDNKGICHAEAQINFANGVSSVTSVENVKSAKYANMADDPIVQTLVNRYSEQIAQGTRVLGVNDSYREGDYLRQLVADLYVQAGVEAFGSNYDIVLGGGYMSINKPYSIPAGDLTYSDLQGLFPYDNQFSSG